MTLVWIVLATFAGGLLSVLVAASLTVSLLSRIVQHLVSLSTGVLLATALLDILPEAFESKASPQALFGTLLAGLMFFFLLEKAELYRHSHHHEGDEHHHHHGFDRAQAGRGGWSVILGDSIHNFCDGIIIAAAFLADTRVGPVTLRGRAVAVDVSVSARDRLEQLYLRFGGRPDSAAPAPAVAEGDSGTTAVACRGARHRDIGHDPVA